MLHPIDDRKHSLLLLSIKHFSSGVEQLQIFLRRFGMIHSNTFRQYPSLISITQPSNSRSQYCSFWKELGVLQTFQEKEEILHTTLESIWNRKKGLRESDSQQRINSLRIRRTQQVLPSDKSIQVHVRSKTIKLCGLLAGAKMR